MGRSASSPRWPARRGLVFGALTAAVVLVVVAGAGTMAYGNSLREDRRLLPGTIVAGVDVGGHTLDEAVAAVRGEVAELLDRPFEVTFGEQSWATTPRQVGATSDVVEVVAEAFERTTRASLVDLARVRLGVGVTSAHDVTLAVPDDAVAAFVAGMAHDVDTPPRDAVLTWADDRVRLQPSVTGLEVQRDRAAAAVEAAIAAGDTEITLPVTEHPPPLPTAEARQVADEVSGVVNAALDHQVTISVADSARTVTPRELGATHNAQALLDARGAAPEDVVLQVPDDVLDAAIDAVDDPHEVPSQDATISWNAADGFTITPGHTGLAVDDEQAREALRAALQGGSDRVALELETTQPRFTRESFQEVLLVRQADRMVDLYRGGKLVRSWEVAVGMPDHPTPTGMFTIGAKRFEPTWHNPALDGWGSDMPAVIGPGRDNPLGLRALNWMRDGYDTLIRFHGTSNLSSIGRAASHGCVRLSNPDVIEMFGLVETGTVIVSVA